MDIVGATQGLLPSKAFNVEAVSRSEVQFDATRRLIVRQGRREGPLRKAADGHQIHRPLVVPLP
jgi:hypothetical protein